VPGGRKAAGLLTTPLDLAQTPQRMMLRTLVAILCASTSLMLSCGSPHSGASNTSSSGSDDDKKVLNLYIWSDYMAPDTVSGFERLTGIKVHVAYFDSYETLEAKILTGHSGFDVVLPTSGSFSREIRAGAYLPLDKTKLPNLRNLDPTMMAQEALSDPGSAHGVVYMTSTIGIGFNQKMIAERYPKAPLTSWRFIFDPAWASKWAPCGINFIDDPVAIVQVVLKFLGKESAEPSADDYAQVEKRLRLIRPYVRTIDTSGEIEATANGDICVSVGYSGDFVQANKRAKEAQNGIQFGYSIPEEGTLLGLDFLAIPKDAVHVDNAHRFINYMMDPHVAANISNFIGFANANLAATPFLDPVIASNTAIYPTPEELRRLFVQRETTSEQSRTITRIWQKFKTGQ
jgi:putrescine transport system substrate-binding protein